jgi:hypothetical protein
MFGQTNDLKLEGLSGLAAEKRSNINVISGDYSDSAPNGG